VKKIIVLIFVFLFTITLPAYCSDGVTVTEMVLFDQSDVKLTMKSIGSSFMGTELKVLVENDGEVPVTVQVRDCSVNDYMIDFVMFSASVVAGKKANDSITFMSSTLNDNGIETIGTVELSFHVSNSDTWKTIFDTEIITIKTSAAEQITQGITETKETVFDQDGITISFVGIDDDTLLGTNVKFFIVNNTDTAITVQTRDESVNGFMIFGMMSCDVLPGKMANASLTFLSSSLEENGIDEIEMIEFIFHIADKNSWKTIIDTDPIEIIP